MQTYWQLNSSFSLQSFTSFHMSIPIIHASTFKIGLWPATAINRGTFNWRRKIIFLHSIEVVEVC